MHVHWRLDRLGGAWILFCSESGVEHYWTKATKKAHELCNSTLVFRNSMAVFMSKLHASLEQKTEQSSCFIQKELFLLQIKPEILNLTLEPFLGIWGQEVKGNWSQLLEMHSIFRDHILRNMISSTCIGNRQRTVSSIFQFLSWVVPPTHSIFQWIFLLSLKSLLQMTWPL